MKLPLNKFFLTVLRFFTTVLFQPIKTLYLWDFSKMPKKQPYRLYLWPQLKKKPDIQKPN